MIVRSQNWNHDYILTNCPALPDVWIKLTGTESISALFSGTPGDKKEFNQRYVLRIQLTTAGFLISIRFSLRRIILFHPMPGMTAALSRRRVSCRELVLPDCDGWLWKKRKESSVFIAQKWQRFWFVLKGPSLYWYTSQQVRIWFNSRTGTLEMQFKMSWSSLLFAICFQ